MIANNYRITLIGEVNFSMITELFNLINKPSIIINSINKHQLKDVNLLFLWIELEFKCNIKEVNNFEENLSNLKEKYSIDIKVEKVTTKNMAVFVSKQDHCLKEVIERWSKGELICNIPLVISEHDIHREYVESYGIPFYKLKLTANNMENDQIASKILMEKNIDFIVLARYMQILSPSFVRKYENKIINIHHSLLPAFIGANTYKRAFERGVKVIGSTAHYVTEKLDEGPILTQKAIHIPEGLTMNEYKHYGQRIESDTLIAAIKYHIEEKVFVYDNKTILV